MGIGARHARRYGYYLRSIGTLMTGLAPPTLVVRIVLGLAGTTPREVRVRRTGLRLLVRDGMDIWVVKETVLDRLYERHGFPVEPGWSVIDIGAGIGEFSLHAAARGARVVAFEPFPGSRALLDENVRRNAADVRVFGHAVAGASGPILLDTTSSAPVYHRSGPAGADRRDGTIEVPALSLGEAMDRAGIDRVDLLKLDCEGAEYDILAGAGPDVLARVDRIVLEYHEWDGHTRADLVTLLERAGFVVRVYANPAYPGIGYLEAARPSE